MRSDFEQILKEYGHDVYLQRKKPNEDELLEKDEYFDNLEKHTARFSVGVHRNLPRAQAEQMEGLVNTTDRTYYFKHDVNPYEGDRIYDYLDRAPRDMEVWSVSASVGMRGANGQIIFWVAGVTRIHPN